MSKKNLFLIVLLAVLAMVYAIWFTDWFQSDTVKIFHTNRYQRTRSARGPAGPVLMFGLSRPLKLTDLQIVSLDAWQTNHNILPVWHLIATSNTVPVKAFAYGSYLRGMKPAVSGARPRPLETNIVYRLFISAGKTKGQHDFRLDGNPTPPQ